MNGLVALEFLPSRGEMLLWMMASYLFGSGSEGTGPRLCPSANFSISEGSSVDLPANIVKHPSVFCLLRKNKSTSRWEDILLINDGNLNFLKNEYKYYFSISHNGLAIKNAAQLLTGHYQINYDFNSSCVQQFELKVFGRWHCPLDNFSLAEGSSKIITYSVPSYSKMLALYKKNPSSSAWKQILRIANGSLINSTQEGHFLIQEGSLAIQNVNEEVTGEYQLVGWYNESCVHQFSIIISGLKGTSDKHLWIFTIIVVGRIILAGIIILAAITRKRKKRNKLACPSERISGSENESFVLNGIQTGGEGLVVTNGCTSTTVNCPFLSNS